MGHLAKQLCVLVGGMPLNDHVQGSQGCVPVTALIPDVFHG